MASPLAAMIRTARRCTSTTLFVLAGCSTLLPVSSIDTQIGWQSFDEARDRIVAIEPFRTRVADLQEAGIDPKTNPAVTLLTYSDILQRFAMAHEPDSRSREVGLTACLEAGRRCTGYSLVIRKVQRKRIGGFWADSLNFRRETEVTGWSFNATLLIVDDLVTYTLWGGQPDIREHEVVRNPLGPLQTWGEQAPSLLR